MKHAVAGLALLVCLTSSAAAQSTTPVLVDSKMTIGAGATVSQAVGEVVARVEDKFVPVRLFEERGRARRTANVAYRFAKLMFFDLPQEQFIWVANHEVFGHGARLRERFDGDIGYQIDWPAPYGDGGGSTSFTLDRAPAFGEFQAINVAGMEASAVAADVVATRAIADGRMTYRDALRYLGFELDTFGYILSTGDDGDEEPGHDVARFIETYNELADLSGGSGLRARTLRREALGALANPVLAFAIWGVGQHILKGGTSVRVPMFRIGGVRYLPLLRYRLTPYGTEWTLVNEIATTTRGAQVEVRIGRAPSETPLGLGMRTRNLATWRSWRLNAAADVWRQPEILKEFSKDSLQSGAQLKVRAERTGRASFIVEAGAKSAGFVPGEMLGAGLVVRAGVGLRLERR